MRLTKRLCALFHTDRYSLQAAANRREHNRFFLAIWCSKCKTLRYIEHVKCIECDYFFKLDVMKIHRNECRLVITANDTVSTLRPSENDFRYLYDVAAKHGLTPPDVIAIASVELNKSLAEFTRLEVIEFAERIAGVDTCR